MKPLFLKMMTTDLFIFTVRSRVLAIRHKILSWLWRPTVVSENKATSSANKKVNRCIKLDARWMPFCLFCVISFVKSLINKENMTWLRKSRYIYISVCFAVFVFSFLFLLFLDSSLHFLVLVQRMAVK